MIYTVTLNPSLDYFVSVEDFHTKKVNRTKTEQIVPGGKGINVSMVLKNLGIASTALGFVAGFTGQEIAKSIKDMGIDADFIQVSGLSRINVKLNKGTEINGQGPNILPEDLEKLYAKLKALKSGDILVLAGSIPNTMPETIYMDMMEKLKDQGISIVVDATGELLKKVLPYGPFLVKPNHHELGELFGVEIKNRQEAADYGKKLLDLGAKNVLVSMGPMGAVLLTENGQVYEADPPDGEVINPVGAGDSMVAGFLTGYLETASMEKALYMGLCAGSASAFSMDMAKREDVDYLFRRDFE